MSPGESYQDRNVRLFGCPNPVAFVTGSMADRVGRVVAEFLAAQDFRIVLHSHEAVEPALGSEHLNLGDKQAALALDGDIETEKNVERWLDSIIEKFGRIDVLVNSAAIWNPKPLEDTRAEDFSRAYEVNTIGPALACKHFGLRMCQQASGGAIINIGDWAVLRPYRDFAAYFPSKAGVAAVTQSMAVELGTRHSCVRVNAVLPGPVKLADSISAERADKIANECLLQREGQGRDVAEAVIYLATAPFVTGVCLPVDGGRSIYAGPSADSIAHPNVES